ncbi:hypothetical protein ACA910_012488 [Epithemia clementina (nom. ined.)]
MSSSNDSQVSSNGGTAFSSDDNILGGVSLGDRSTVIVHARDKARPSFVKCGSLGPFENPTSPKPPLSPEEVNRSLNLNLGQKFISPENKTILWILRFLNSVLLEWWEPIAFRLWDRLPLAWRKKLCIGLWKLYLPIHKFLLGRRTGLHPDASDEYHAMTTFMWWGRLFPVTVRRMRFSLSQLNVTDGPISGTFIKSIDEPLTGLDPALIPDQQKEFCTVRGLFLHRQQQCSSANNDNEAWTILWVYGGAFLSGDVKGNSGKADWISKQTNMDVFVCNYRLVPEYRLDDVYWDICVVYKWLSQRRNPQKIVLLGISSGAAVCVRLMQFIAERQRGETLLPDYVEPLVNGMEMPAGAVLMGPFADFTEPRGALIHYAKHDLIVNQRVLDAGLPYLETHIPYGKRKEYSPVHRSFQGLPPMCVVISEHEAVYEMAVDLVNRARRDGVPVTVGCWKYMCHVFSFLNAFIPEGRQSMEFMCAWIRFLQNKKSQASVRSK